MLTILPHLVQTKAKKNKKKKQTNKNKTNKQTNKKTKHLVYFGKPQDLNWLQLTTSTMLWAKIVNVFTITYKCMSNATAM